MRRTRRRSASSKPSSDPRLVQPQGAIIEPELDPAPQARIIPLGEPIEGGAVLFAGSLDHARDYLALLDPDQRAAVSIWTPGHVFSAAELEATPRGAEHG